LYYGTQVGDSTVGQVPDFLRRLLDGFRIRPPTQMALIITAVIFFLVLISRVLSVIAGIVFLVALCGMFVQFARQQPARAWVAAMKPKSSVTANDMTLAATIYGPMIMDQVSGDTALNIKNAADIATVVTAIATVVATIGGLLLLLATLRQLKVAARQLRLNERQLGLSADVEEANFWLQLRQMFKAHDEVHHKLIPGGDWWDTGAPILQTTEEEVKEEEEEEVKEEEEEDDRFEVPWAKDRIVEVGAKYRVPWLGHTQPKTVPELEKMWKANLPKGPADQCDWRKVEDYMGLFEHCEAMLRKELIDPSTFKEIYRYRLINIMLNRRIVIAKLGCNRKSWKGFIQLLNRVGIEIPPKENLRINKLCRSDTNKESMPMFGE
jgi:hypothetical protein